MKRGDIFLAVISGDYGKARPVVVVQNDHFNETHDSITVCPITTFLVETPLFRLNLSPSGDNGLRLPSQIMVDKVTSIKRDRLRGRIGRIHNKMLVQIDRSLAYWLGLQMDNQV